MGSTKSLVMDQLEDDYKVKWILENGPSGIKQGSYEWDEWELDYYHTHENDGIMRNDDDGMDDYYLDLNIEEEIQWAKRNGHIEAYNNFLNELEDMSKLMAAVKSPNSRMVLKMRLSYAVTLMESCLKEMLVSAAFARVEFTQNAANIPAVSEIKIPVNSVLNDEAKKIVEKRIYKVLNDLLYHRFVDVFNYYKIILNTSDFDIEKDVKDKVVAAISLRHDIVHRNGKDKDGKEVPIEKSIIDDYLKEIESFTLAMREFITGSMDALEVEAINDALEKLGHARLFK